MSRREPIFNFSEPAPVWLATGLILAYFAERLAPSGLQNTVRTWAVLAADNGSVMIDRADVSSLWSLLLHALVHSDFMHVLMNSAMITVFGVLVCRAGRLGLAKRASWRGPMRFFMIFCLSVIAGGLAQWGYWAASGATALAIGASGGASGLFAASAWALGGKKRVFQYGAGWVLLNAIIVLGAMMGAFDSNIAWAAHLGGYVGGALAAISMLRPGSTDFVITR